MDSNVVGRYYTGPTGRPPLIQRIVVRDLTDETEGNAVGIGMADVVHAPRRRPDGPGEDVHELRHREDAGGRPDRADRRHGPRGASTSRIACCLQVDAGAGSDRPHPRHEAPRVVLATTALLPELAATGACEIARPAAPIAFD